MVNIMLKSKLNNTLGIHKILKFMVHFLKSSPTASDKIKNEDG